MVVSFREYQEDLKAFCEKHNKNSECTIVTSPFTNNQYHKSYMYSDGATFTEINERIFEEIETEIHGIKVKTMVELFRTEYWSTDNSRSNFVYERV